MKTFVPCAIWYLVTDSLVIDDESTLISAVGWYQTGAKETRMRHNMWHDSDIIAFEETNEILRQNTDTTE